MVSNMIFSKVIAGSSKHPGPGKKNLQPRRVGAHVAWDVEEKKSEIMVPRYQIKSIR